MRPSLYLAALLGLTLPAFAAAYAASRSWTMEAACDARGYSDDSYLAYCQNEAFGDYEHAAYHLRLEPEAVEAARRADVVLLGDSRMQVAFSRPATERFFAARGARHHLMGFGYGEGAPFAFRVFHELGLKPRALIVNVDPFFQPAMTPAGSLALRTAWKTRVDFALKRLAQPLHRLLCGRDPSPCPGGSEAVFRSRATGEWIWAAARSPAPGAAFAPPTPLADEAAIRADAAMAEAMLAGSGVRPGCVVLTQVPQPFADYAPLVDAVAQRTGAAVALPRLDGLATFDGSHLDRASGDRWADAFFREAAPALDRCLAGNDEPARAAEAAR